MNVSPLELRQQKFSTAFRGFDPVEVGAFLTAVADDYENAVREADRLRQELARMEGQLKGHLEQEKSLQSALIMAQKMADTIKANIYADNWFIMYINGELVAIDSIKFIPHNVVSVDILPTYPMTIAVMAKDNADPKTGLEYAGTHIGDGGFILKFGDGTVTNAKWKAKCFFTGPLDKDVKNPKVKHDPIPDNWWAVDFDDSKWDTATEYPEGSFYVTEANAPHYSYAVTDIIVQEQGVGPSGMSYVHAEDDPRVRR